MQSKEILKIKLITFLMVWSILKPNKKSYKNVNIYYIGYIAIKRFDNYENIHSANPLYLVIGEADGYIEENNGIKYLTFASSDKNKELLKKYAKLCMKINIWSR